MIPAGKPVDAAIASIKPVLERGDLLIDGGNTFFTDTERRFGRAGSAGHHLTSARGVSGGELWRAVGGHPSCPADSRKRGNW